mmetsp:Transcript_28271/g.24980  ORF Transcript_28271/g.24980 Transcript_28271/m.24980 type:complete len:192 (+) Transcript_28271:43-618(+)
MNQFNLLLILTFIIGVYSSRSPTYNNRYPTPYPTTRYPTRRPTQAFNNIFVAYNLSKLDEADYQIDLQGVNFKNDMSDEVQNGITAVIQPSPTPTNWYYPDVETIQFSEADKTLDLYMNIEVYWQAADEIKETQSSLIFENTMEGLLQTYFNTSELQFSVDKTSIRLVDSGFSFKYIISVFIVGFFGIILF